jgi:hypothetical protein
MSRIFLQGSFVERFECFQSSVKSFNLSFNHLFNVQSFSKLVRAQNRLSANGEATVLFCNDDRYAVCLQHKYWLLLAARQNSDYCFSLVYCLHLNLGWSLHASRILNITWTLCMSCMYMYIWNLRLTLHMFRRSWTVVQFYTHLHVTHTFNLGSILPRRL